MAVSPVKRPMDANLARRLLASLRGNFDRMMREEREALQLENKKAVMGLRLELQQTRERSLSLLEEKDAEIHKLRSQVGSDYCWLSL